MNTGREVDQCLESAGKIAQQMGHNYITTEHMLLAMLKRQDFAKVLIEYGVQVQNLMQDLDEYLTNKYKNIGKSNGILKTQALERIFNRALTSVLFSGRESLTLYDLFVSMCSENNTHSSYFLIKYGVDKKEFIDFLKHNVQIKEVEDQKSQYFEGVINEYCQNISKEAADGKIDPVVGRQKELDEIVETFARRNKSNVLMVGDPGTGKTAIAESIAVRIRKGKVPDYLQGYTVYSLDIGTMLAGTQYRGQFEERVKDVMDALVQLGNTILFIDEAHQMRGAGAGGNGGTDFANMLKPYLSKGKMKVIASTTWEEYNASFEKDRALMRRFYRITVDEPTPELAKKIITASAKYYKEFHNCTYTQEALDASVDLSVRYLTDKRLPDKAFDMIDLAAAKKRRQGIDNAEITKQDIIEVVSQYAGVPVEDEDKVTKTPLEVADDIKSQVYGQDSAVDTVLDRVWIAKSGLNKRDKTLGVFVFTGPTGTGKTELAKALASSNQMKLLRYDMSEYQEKHTVAKFIGAPPGYVGFEDSSTSGGQLINDIERNPHAILLFDEIEKAHPDVSNVLLQLMDEGFITGSNGKRADARNCYIILTTNLGARDSEKNLIGFGRGTDDDAQDNAYKKFFAPEWRNRVDAVCAFNKLDDLAKRKICAKFIKELERQLESKDIELRVEEDAVDYLVSKGYDENMGARPMARTIDSELRMPIAKQIMLDSMTKPVKIIIRMQDEILNIKIRYENGQTRKFDVTGKDIQSAS